MGFFQSAILSHFKKFALIFLMVHFILLWLLPQTYYTWGIDFLRYLPIPFQLFWYLVGVIGILMIPDNLFQCPQSFFHRFNGVYQKLAAKNRAYPLLVFILTSIAFMGVMFIFRQKYHLLGDKIFPQGLPTEISFYRLSDIVRDTTGILGGKFQSYLFINHPRDLLYFISILHGGIFVFLALLFARDIGRSFSEQLYLFLFLVTGQYLFIFFGTEDNYYTVLVFFLWYFYELFRTFEGKGTFWRLLLSCLLAIYSHPEGLAFVPSCFFAAYYYFDKSRIRNIFLLIVCFLSILGYFVLLKYSGKSGAIFNVPLFVESNYRLPVFSLYKISYFFNIYFANALVGATLFFIGLYNLIRRKVIRERKPVWMVLSIVPFVFICDLFAEHALGIGDQDLGTVSAFIITLIGLWFLLKSYKNLLPVSLLVLNIWLLIPIVFVFHTDATVNRMVYLYPNDRAQVFNQSSPYYWLGQRFHYENDLQDEVLHQFKLGTTLAKTNKQQIFCMVNYSYWSYRYGKSDEGREALTYLLEKVPEQASLYFQQIPRFPEEMRRDTIFISEQLYAKAGNPVYQQIVDAIGKNKL